MALRRNVMQPSSELRISTMGLADECTDQKGKGFHDANQ